MKKRNTRLIIRVVSTCIFLGCMFYITNFYYQGYANQQMNQALSEMKKDDIESSAQIKVITNDSIGAENKTSITNSMTNENVRNSNQELTNQKDINFSQQNKSYNVSAGNVKHTPEILSQFKVIYEKNTDFIGWINVPGTLIDYPVLQGDDNEYYLNHDFYGDISNHGSIFMDYKSDVLLPSTNFILYGHNMKDGTMFSALRKYKDQSFFENHKFISFHTIYEKSQYEIISVFLSQVYLKNEDVFKYYQFIHAFNREEFDEFYHNIKELSLYDTKNEAQYGDTFITLSTCDYTTENGRLVVVAKKIETKEE